MAQKIYSNMHPVSCTNTHHDVTDLLYHSMAKDTKTWISRKWNITFVENKKILNLCLRLHILQSYCFVAEKTFKCHYIIIVVHFFSSCEMCHLSYSYCSILSLLKIHPNLPNLKSFKCLSGLSKWFVNMFCCTDKAIHNYSCIIKMTKKETWNAVIIWLFS